MRLRNKVSLITGAGAGIGAEIAERLQALLLGSTPEVEEAAPAERTNRRAPRPGRSGRSAAEKRSGKRRA